MVGEIRQSAERNAGCNEEFAQQIIAELVGDIGDEIRRGGRHDVGPRRQGRAVEIVGADTVTDSN